MAEKESHQQEGNGQYCHLFISGTIENLATRGIKCDITKTEVKKKE